MLLKAEQILESASALRTRTPQRVLEWSIAAFDSRLALTVSFGGAGVVLAHMLSQIAPWVPVLFLDTGLLFEETYALKNEFVGRYGLKVIELHPRDDPGPLYETDPDRCCEIRKIEPMALALKEYDAWMSAVRRDQSLARADTETLELHEVDGREVIKIHPLAYWDREKVWRYIVENSVPYNPLLDRGYSSIGCWPCTRATRPGEHERDGRWSGTGKTECGLHTFTRKSD
jgi:phosphoadenosine phosphosulfate reductase